MTKALIIASALVCSSLLGQNIQKPDSLSILTLLTEPSGADIFIDSIFVGKSPVQNISIQRGAHRIKAFYPSVFSWNASMAEETLEVEEGRVLQKHIVLSNVLRIQTEPAGSNVLYEGKVLGVTPLYVRNASTVAGTLIIQKNGYDSLAVPFNEIREGFLRLQLHPAGNPVTRPSSGDLLGPDLAATDRWPTYVSGLTMIVSGVTSAYFKDQANKEFDRYLLSNDPAALSTTRRLDREAAVSLIISQISFVVLSYFLLSE